MKNSRGVEVLLAEFLLVESLGFSIPLFLDDLYDIALVLRLEDRQVDLYGALSVHGCRLSLGRRDRALEGLLRSSAWRGVLTELDCGTLV